MNFLIAQLIYYAFRFVEIVIFASVILSWVSVAQHPRPRWMYHPLIRWVDEMAFRILRPFRQLLAAVGLRTGPIDFSPFVALLVLDFVARFLIRLLLT